MMDSNSIFSDNTLRQDITFDIKAHKLESLINLILNLFTIYLNKNHYPHDW